MLATTLTCLLLLLSPTSTTAAQDDDSGPPGVSVSKCCPDEQVLDVSDPRDPKCTDTTNNPNPFITIKGLATHQSPVEEVLLRLTQNQQQPNKMPGCMSDFEVHLIEDSG